MLTELYEENTHVDLIYQVDLDALLALDNPQPTTIKKMKATSSTFPPIRLNSNVHAFLTQTPQAIQAQQTMSHFPITLLNNLLP